MKVSCVLQIIWEDPAFLTGFSRLYKSMYVKTAAARRILSTSKQCTDHQSSAQKEWWNQFENIMLAIECWQRQMYNLGARFYHDIIFSWSDVINFPMPFFCFRKQYSAKISLSSLRLKHCEKCIYIEPKALHPAISCICNAFYSIKYSGHSTSSKKEKRNSKQRQNCTGAALSMGCIK